MKKQLPIGIKDFKEIIEGNYFYLDKTDFIHEVLEKRSAVKLITRPKQFGKTLNLSALKYFLDIRNSEKNRELFSGLNIEKSRNMSSFGKHPVIYLSLEDVPVETYEQFLESMKEKFKKLCEEHSYLYDFLNAYEKKKFDKIMLGEKEPSTSWLDSLADLLGEYHKSNTVILIDEYDAPMLNSIATESAESIQNFLMHMYGHALKDSKAAFSVITGTTRIIMDPVNNLTDSSIFDKSFNHYGISEAELEEVLEKYSSIENLEKVKKDYGGYVFSKKKVYNPLEIFKYCILEEADSYDTGIETLIERLMKYDLKNDPHGYHKIDLETFFEEKGLNSTEDVIIILDKDKRYMFSYLVQILIGAGYLSPRVNPEEKYEYDRFIRFEFTNLKIENALKRIFFKC